MRLATHLAFVVVYKENVTGHALDVFKIQHRSVVLQLWIDVNVVHYFGDFRSHTMLQAQSLKWHSIVYHSLEQRHVQIVVFGELKDSGIGAELLMITNQNQVLASGS